MFIANMFGMIALYSTKEFAERALVKFIIDHKLGHSYENYKSFIKDFKQLMQQENYSKAINCWNEFATINYNGNSLYQARVDAVKIDKDF